MGSKFGTSRASLLGCTLALAALTAAPVVAQPTYTTFDVPGSTGTGGASINDAGTVSGSYSDSKGVEHGFVRAGDGIITAFDPAGSADTHPLSINSLGVITGFYIDTNGVWHGFVRKADGTIINFDPPGSMFTYASSINSAGTVTGSYSYSNNIIVLHGFVRTPDGAITGFDVPNASGTSPASINGSGEITGFYGGSANYGFVRAPDGTFSSIHLRHPRTSVFPLSINDEGNICGYVDGEAFVRAADGHLEAFDPSLNPKGFEESEATSVNDNDVATGFYGQSYSAVHHSFVRAHDGTLARFEVPGSTSTVANSINNKGQITGIYEDSNGVFHGFLRTP